VPVVERAQWWVWALAGALIATYALLTWLGRMPGIWTGQDDVQYLLLSRSLRAFQYREMFRVDTPIPAMYPPGYPALLAIWALIYREQFDWMILLNVLAMAGSLLLVFKVVRREWGPAAGLLCLAPLAVNQNLVRFGGSIASESPYIGLSILSLFLLWRHGAGEKSGESTSNWALAGAAAVAIVASLTRSAGVTIILGICAYWFFQRHWLRLAMFLTASAMTVGAWQLWTILAPEKLHQRSYIGDLAATTAVSAQKGFLAVLFERLYWNVPFYITEDLYTNLSMPFVSGTLIDNLLGSVVMLAGLAVGIVLLYGRWRVAFWYVMAYGALLALWPYRVARFVVPMIPILTPICIVGFGWLMGRFVPRGRLPAMVALSLIMTLTGAYKTRELVQRRLPCDRWGSGSPRTSCLQPDQASFFTAAAYIRETVPTDATVLSAKGAVLYYYSQRRVGPRERAFTQTPASYVPFLRDYKIDHVLLGSLYVNEIKQLGDLMHATCEHFSVVAAFPPRTYLFRLREQPVARSESDACRAMKNYQEANANRDLWTEDF
jgi:hypothetical protein